MASVGQKIAFLHIGILLLDSAQHVAHKLLVIAKSIKALDYIDLIKLDKQCVLLLKGSLCYRI